MLLSAYHVRSLNWVQYTQKRRRRCHANSRGEGTPARVLPLLWGERESGSRGPKPGLTVDRIVAAAIAISDAEGLDGLTMRAVAERVGAGAMSLYRYVPGKAELLDLMVDRVNAETDRFAFGCRRVARAPGRDRAGEPSALRATPMAAASIRGAASARAGDHRQVRLRTGHPGGPWADRRGDGYDPDARPRFRAWVGGERGRGVAGGGGDGSKRRPMVARRGAHLDKVFDARLFPLAARVGVAATDFYQGVGDPRHAFEFGLARLLDGIEIFIERTSDG